MLASISGIQLHDRRVLEQRDEVDARARVASAQLLEERRGQHDAAHAPHLEQQDLPYLVRRRRIRSAPREPLCAQENRTQHRPDTTVDPEGDFVSTYSGPRVLHSRRILARITHEVRGEEAEPLTPARNPVPPAPGVDRKGSPPACCRATAGAHPDGPAPRCRRAAAARLHHIVRSRAPDRARRGSW